MNTLISRLLNVWKPGEGGAIFDLCTDEQVTPKLQPELNGLSDHLLHDMGYERGFRFGTRS